MKEIIAIYGVLIGIILAIGFAIGAVLWPYIIGTWALYLTGKVVVITWWQGGLLGFVPAIGQMSIPLAVFTWIFMLIFI